MSTGQEVRNNRILVIDDNPSIHEDIKRILCGRGQPDSRFADRKAFLFDEAPEVAPETVFEVDSAMQGQEGLRKVELANAAGRPYALAFVDVRMPPGWDGVETVTRIWKDFPDLQVVIVTAYSDYSWEEMIKQLGKSDSLVILKKPFDTIEVMQLAHALTGKWDLNQEVRGRLQDLDNLVNQRTAELQSANEQLKQEIAERMQIEKSLRLSEERFSKAFKASPIPLAIQSLHEEIFIDTNQGFQDLTGYSWPDLIGHTPDELDLWGQSDGGQNLLRKLHDQMFVRNFGCRLKTKSGGWRETLISMELFELDGQFFILSIVQDISEQVRLENQLRQSQKMEAVGQLAAGVAHDFNNILTIVQGYTGLLLEAQPPQSKERKPLQTIAAAAERATRLVRQLLAFSRKQFIQLQPVRIDDALANLGEMLPRLVGEHITVNILAHPRLPLANADAGMVEQALVNLAVNARDAMPSGGHLTIGADEVELDPAAVRRNSEARLGRFISLSVSDTGCGIPPEILPRIFEPFFTTKAVGKGTGLGLATVYGIVKQHEGWIEVESLPGKGSTFRVFIPVSEQKSALHGLPSNPARPGGGNETILVTEDEPDVRNFVVEILQAHGYSVLSAASGPEALEVWSRHQAEIDLLLTDMIMPGGLSGRELGDRLSKEKSTLRVIYTSGYSPGMADGAQSVLNASNFLAKPHGAARLLQMVRDCLNPKQPSALPAQRANGVCPSLSEAHG